MSTKNALSSRYPYLWAWGAELGSFPYFMRDESALAAEDGVPDDVIYRDEWSQVGSLGRHERALEAEQAGEAVILRDENGQPYRVWYRASAIRDPHVAERVHRYADNLRHGRPARA